MNLLDQMLQDNQAIMLVYSGEILGCDHFKQAIRAEIDERVRNAIDNEIRELVNCGAIKP